MFKYVQFNGTFSPIWKTPPFRLWLEIGNQWCQIRGSDSSLYDCYVAGFEAVGEVTAVGPGLTGRMVGDLVAYAGNPLGSYAEEEILPANVTVPVPSSIDPTVAASIMLKGMTAQFLVRRCFKVSSPLNHYISTDYLDLFGCILRHFSFRTGK